MTVNAAAPQKRGCGFYLFTVPAGVIYLSAQGIYALIKGIVRESLECTGAGFREIGKGLKNSPQVVYYTMVPIVDLNWNGVWEAGTYVPAGAIQGWRATKVTAQESYYLLGYPLGWAGKTLYHGGTLGVGGALELIKAGVAAGEVLGFAWDVSRDTVINQAYEVADYSTSGAMQVAEFIENAYAILTMSGQIKIIFEEMGTYAESGGKEVAKLGINAKDAYLNALIPTAEVTISVAQQLTEITIMAALYEGLKGARTAGKELWVVGDVTGEQLERYAREAFDLIVSMGREGWKGSKEGGQLALFLLKYPAPFLIGSIRETLLHTLAGAVEGYKLGRNIAREAYVAGDLVGDPVALWWLESKQQFREWLAARRG